MSLLILRALLGNRPARHTEAGFQGSAEVPSGRSGEDGEYVRRKLRFSLFSLLLVVLAVAAFSSGVLFTANFVVVAVVAIVPANIGPIQDEAIARVRAALLDPARVDAAIVQVGGSAGMPARSWVVEHLETRDLRGTGLITIHLTARVFRHDRRLTRQILAELVRSVVHDASLPPTRIVVDATWSDVQKTDSP